MTSAISNYSSFITDQDNNFFTHLDTHLATGKILKSHRIEMVYLERVGKTWDDFTKNMIRSTFNYIPPLIMEDNFKLYERLKQELKTITDNQDTLVECYLMDTIFANPVHSPVVQAYLQAFREDTLEDAANPLQQLKRSINTISSKIFEMVLKDSSKEYRVLNKKIFIEYSPTEDPSVSSSDNFEKDYTLECSVCHKWQTTAKTLSKCAGCLMTCYCSTKCQKTDWKFHKAQCKQK